MAAPVSSVKASECPGPPPTSFRCCLTPWLREFLFAGVAADDVASWRAALIGNVVVLPLSLVGALVGLQQGSWMIVTAGLLPAAASAVMLVSMLCSRKITSWAMHLFCYTYTLAMLMLDMRGLHTNTVQWPTCILLLDMILLVRHKTMNITSRVVVAVLAVYLLAKQLDTSQRMWLYSVDSPRLPEVCDCESPPCAASFSTAVLRAFVAIVVTVLDFILTRGFATQVLEEKDRMRLSINAAQSIAACLARFDLDAAEELLDTDTDSLEHMPQGLSDALRDILSNLGTYKPYLPRSCLPGSEVQPSEGDATRGTPDLPDLPLCTTLEELPTALSSQTAEMVRKSATLLVSNVRGSLQNLGGEGCVDFAPVMLEHALHIMHSRGGVLDLFLGDRVYASFNTSRPKLRHAVLAASAVKEYTLAMRASGWDVTAGLATGPVVCGDLGSSDIRRFTVLGTLPMEVWAMERVARALGLTVVANRLCFQEAGVDFVGEFRLVPRLVRVVKATPEEDVALHTPHAITAYELIVHRTTGPGHKRQEWMYELEARDVWRSYNALVEAFLKGETTTTLHESAVEGSPAFVQDAVQKVVTGQVPEALRVAV